MAKRIIAIFGKDIGYTLSPKMHNHAFKKLKLPFEYKIYDGQRTAEEIAGLILNLDMRGANITIPFKKKVYRYFVRKHYKIDPLAERIGAINTICNKNGHLIGYNTDAEGFMTALQQKLDPRDKSVVIIGAGGSAHAIAMALADAKVKKIAVFNRTLGRAKDLCVHIANHHKNVVVEPFNLYVKHGKNRAFNMKELKPSFENCHLLINATQTAMDRLADEAIHILPRKSFVFDIVYDKETPLIKAAKRAGNCYMDGLEMLIHQGARAFSIWTGKKPPVQLMREALHA
ncbi:MAG: shikimate dehydrogenase [Elusimicrobia bacterium RIFCSPLOWO2_01_FULL_64_13]|nr:MAG: shikimate dehydrogenase [Elusimicrobia bacterium RIFCSPLOWO2_01_FULL_64_13]